MSGWALTRGEIIECRAKGDSQVIHKSLRIFSIMLRSYSVAQ